MRYGWEEDEEENHQRRMRSNRVEVENIDIDEYKEPGWDEYM